MNVLPEFLKLISKPLKHNRMTLWGYNGCLQAGSGKLQTAMLPPDANKGLHTALLKDLYKKR